MDYCFHLWVVSFSCYLNLLDKLQKRVCITVRSSLANSREPIECVHSLSLFYSSYRCSSELIKLVPLPYSSGRSTLFSKRLHTFSANIPICYTDANKDAYFNSFFPGIATLLC